MSRPALAAFASLLLAAGAASAADLPSRRVAPAYTPVAPVFTWTGFYAGTLTGYDWSDKQRVRTVGNDAFTSTGIATGVRPGAVSIKEDGFTSFGGGGGYDYQFTPGAGVVVGVAADATLMDIERRRETLGSTGLRSGFRQDLDYLGTVRGRVGYAFDRFLVYGTGGFAFGGVDYRANFLNAAGTLGYTGRSNQTETGYVYGGGVEYALPTDSFLTKFSVLSLIGIQSQAITLKAEYLHYDLGHGNVVVAAAGPGAVGSYTSRFQTEGNLVRGGLTYRFGGL